MPQPGAGLVYGDGDEPGAELRLRPKSAQVLQRLQHRILRCVFGVLWVLQDGEGREVHALLVGPHQLMEELALASEDARDQFGIANCRRIARHRAAAVYFGCHVNPAARERQNSTGINLVIPEPDNKLQRDGGSTDLGSDGENGSYNRRGAPPNLLLVGWESLEAVS